MERPIPRTSSWGTEGTLLEVHVYPHDPVPGLTEVVARRLETAVVRVARRLPEPSLARRLMRVRVRHPLARMILEMPAPLAERRLVSNLALQCGIAITVGDARNTTEVRRAVPGVLVIAGAIEGWCRTCFVESRSAAGAVADVLRAVHHVTTGARLAVRLGHARRTMDRAFRRLGLPSPSALLRTARALGIIMERHRHPDLSWEELCRMHSYSSVRMARKHVKLLAGSLSDVDALPCGGWEPLLAPLVVPPTQLAQFVAPCDDPAQGPNPHADAG